MPTLKYHNGAEFIDRTLKRYDGEAFVDAALKVRIGEEFVSVGGGAPASNLVSWTDGVNVAIDGNTVTKNAGGADFNAGAFSVEGLTGEGRLKYTLNYDPSPGFSVGFQLGLSVLNSSVHFDTIDFCWAFVAGTWRIYEDGAFNADYDAIAQGDVLEIIRTGTTLDYHINGVSKRTRAVAADSLLKADLTIYGQGISISGVELIPA